MAAEKIPAKRFGQSRNKTPQSTLTGDERARGLRGRRDSRRGPRAQAGTAKSGAPRPWAKPPARYSTAPLTRNWSMMSARRERWAAATPWAGPRLPPTARQAGPAVNFRFTPRSAPPAPRASPHPEAARCAPWRSASGSPLELAAG